jgi:hypothetical protein
LYENKYALIIKTGNLKVGKMNFGVFRTGIFGVHSQLSPINHAVANSVSDCIDNKKKIAIKSN